MESIEKTKSLILKDQGVVMKEVKAVSIKNDEDYAMASEMLTKVVARKKRVEAKRKEYVQLLNDQVKMINSDFKEMLSPYVSMEAKIKEVMRKYAEKKRLQEEAKAEKERERQREEARKLAEQENISRQKAQAKIKAEAEEKARNKPAPAQSISRGTVKTETSKVVTKMVKKFEIVDEHKNPRKFLKVDETSIRKAIMAGEKRIAGVRIYEESQIVAH